jgi:uncharacterized protein YbjT (DUF2867 family)
VIALAGGTSRLGRVLLPLLDGQPVRVLTRERARGEGLGVEVVEGDARDPAALAALVRGCDTVVSAMHGFVAPGGPEAIDRDANRALIAAAKDAGVGHFVLVSVQGASPDHPMSLHRAKFAAEEVLRQSGLRYTIVRPTAFLETWTTIIGGPLAEKGHALVFGPGRNPINFVAVKDVAQVVARAVRDGRLERDTVEIGGENLAMVTLAQRLVDAHGAGTIKHIPLPILRAMSVLARPFSPSFARQARAAVVMNTFDFTL